MIQKKYICICGERESGDDEKIKEKINTIRIWMKGVPFSPFYQSQNFNVFLKSYQNQKLNTKRNTLLNNLWFIEEITRKAKKCFRRNDNNTACRL